MFFANDFDRYPQDWWNRYSKVLGAVECKGFFGGGVYLGVVKKGKIGIPNFNLGGVFWRRLGRDTFKQTNIILNYQSSNFA